MPGKSLVKVRSQPATSDEAAAVAWAMFLYGGGLGPFRGMLAFGLFGLGSALLAEGLVLRSLDRSLSVPEAATAAILTVVAAGFFWLAVKRPYWALIALPVLAPEKVRPAVLRELLERAPTPEVRRAVQALVTGGRPVRAWRLSRLMSQADARKRRHDRLKIQLADAEAAAFLRTVPPATDQLLVMLPAPDEARRVF